MKTQVVMDHRSKRIICTAYGNGKKHDFRLYKESHTHINPKILVGTDSGYTGIKKIHANSVLPKKSSKKHLLTKDEKADNRRISSLRVCNEHVIGRIKVFRIISGRYRNKRRRFGLRLNLIAGIYNREYGY